ncbi:hypothetical protein DYB32_010344 [Aphanomyces invadans]|uniref:Endonuclease/exonuclease/phosphatase domain-containing protein n=1 Tax=Aphanomyces invadans TaxID=157072 RepID=A0A3R7CSZ6_9STRA|nr:hypothetical protein DYB32_010344 [Aphanomyces invadans]
MRGANIVALQETKLKDSHHLSTFTYHTQHALGHGKFFLAVNDPRVVADHVSSPGDDPAHRSGGVALVLDDTVPGFRELQHLVELGIPYKYMLVRTHWQETPVYFHCVYAPVQSADRAAYFDSLPREFPENSAHLILGDLNLPMDPYLDAENPHHNHSVGRVNCLEWLNAASRLLEIICTAHNPGVVRHAWKKRTRCFLQQAHQHVKSHYSREKALSVLRLTEARRLHADGISSDQDLEDEEKIFLEAVDLWKLYHADLNFDVHASKNERSTAHFFRPLTKVLYKTPVRSAR